MAKVTTKRAVRKQATTMTLGIDLGDRESVAYGFDPSSGEVMGTRRVAMEPESLEEFFGGMPPVRVVMETGTHANWVSRMAARHGHEVLVAQSRKLDLISRNEKKCDELDAKLLAEIGATRPSLLSPVRLRSEAAQRQLAVLRARDTVVKTRTEIAQRDGANFHTFPRGPRHFGPLPCDFRICRERAAAGSRATS